MLHRIHLPEERARLSEAELRDAARHMAELRISVRNLELNSRIPLAKMVDFEKLANRFFREKKYSHGVPIAEGEGEN